MTRAATWGDAPSGAAPAGRASRIPADLAKADPAKIRAAIAEKQATVERLSAALVGLNRTMDRAVDRAAFDAADAELRWHKREIEMSQEDITDLAALLVEVEEREVVRVRAALSAEFQKVRSSKTVPAVAAFVDALAQEEVFFERGVSMGGFVPGNRLVTWQELQLIWACATGQELDPFERREQWVKRAVEPLEKVNGGRR